MATGRADSRTMADFPNKVRITVGSVQLDAELKSTKTAQEVYAALPVESPVNTWGEEFYFKLAGVKDHRETATNQVKVGDVVGIREGSKKKPLFATLDDKLKTVKIPSWLKLDFDKKEITVEGLPQAPQSELLFNVGAVLEFFSR